MAVKYFTVKSRFTACGNIDKPAQQWNILCFQRMPARAKQVKRLSVQEEDRFLRFMNDQLCSCIEILAGMFPYEGTVIPFVFDNIGNLCHDIASSNDEIVYVFALLKKVKFFCAT